MIARLSLNIMTAAQLQKAWSLPQKEFQSGQRARSVLGKISSVAAKL